MKKVIKMPKFKFEILNTYDLEELKEIAQQGCSGGSAGAHIYYHQTTKAYDEHSEEIWDWLNESAEDLGFNNTLLLIASLGGSRKVSSDDTFKNLLVWAYIESVAYDEINKDGEE